MRNFFVSVLMLVVAVDARRARRERQTTSTDSDDGPPAAFTACTNNDDATIVADPRKNHSKLPIDMLMAENDDEVLDSYLKWKGIYGGDDAKTITDQAK